MKSTNDNESGQQPTTVRMLAKLTATAAVVALIGLILTGATLAPGSNAPRHLDAAVTNLVSVNQSGTSSGNGLSGWASISADGRLVAFTSLSSDLVAHDDNGKRDVFVRDLKKSVTTLVSVNRTGTGGGNGSSGDISGRAVISEDGRFVAFESFATDLVAHDNNNTYDVFVRDLKKGLTTLVSVNESGTDSGNSNAFRPQISADGRYVLFRSRASDLVAADTNGDVDVFVRDLKTRRTRLVTVNHAGTDSGNGFSDEPQITPEGRYVAFTSRANDLVTNDTNGKSDVFVRDLKTGRTTLVSVDETGTTSGNNSSTTPVLSRDGRYVAFLSAATDLVAQMNSASYNVPAYLQPPTVFNVFVRDLKKRTTTLVSVDQNGAAAGVYSQYLSISADGRYVAFVSSANDLAGNDSNGQADVFVRDVKKATTALVSVNHDGTDSGNGFSYGPHISADGRYVIFQSFAADLVLTDSHGHHDLFLRDLKNGITRLLSINESGTDSGNNVSDWNALSGDGRYVVFSSEASDLVANDNNGTYDVFVRRIR